MVHEELCYQIKEFLISKQLAPTSILLFRLFTVLCNEHWLSFSYSAIVLAVLLSTLANIKHIPMKIPKLVKNLVGESLYCTLYSVQYSQSWPVAPSGVIPKDPHELRDVRATRVIFRISKDDLALSCQGGICKTKIYKLIFSIYSICLSFFLGQRGVLPVHVIFLECLYSV